MGANQGQKKSDFLVQILPKNWFSVGMEKIFTKDNRKSKIWQKIGKIADFSSKNLKIPIFPPKNRDCGAHASQARFGGKNCQFFGDFLAFFGKKKHLTFISHNRPPS